MNKEALCKAFCNEIELREVPSGLAVSTPFYFSDGDRVGFYISEVSGKFQLEDSGLLVPFLEGTGLNLESGMRAEQFNLMLQEYNAVLDNDTMEIHSIVNTEMELPGAALKFVALLLRLQDLQLLKHDIVEKTFVEDAKEAIYRHLSAYADIQFDAAPLGGNSDFLADAVIYPHNSDHKLAVYLGVRDARVDEAVMLWMECHLKQIYDKCAIAVLYENDSPDVSKRAQRRAANRVDAALYFQGDESAVLDKIARLAKIHVPPIEYHPVSPTPTKH